MRCVAVDRLLLLAVVFLYKVAVSHSEGHEHGDGSREVSALCVALALPFGMLGENLLCEGSADLCAQFLLDGYARLIIGDVVLSDGLAATYGALTDSRDILLRCSAHDEVDESLNTRGVALTLVTGVAEHVDSVDTCGDENAVDGLSVLIVDSDKSCADKSAKVDGKSVMCHNFYFFYD